MHCSHLTDSDGVDLALDLQGALVTLVSINHLLQLCVVDHQVLGTFMVLLQVDEEAGKKKVCEQESKEQDR